MDTGNTRVSQYIITETELVKSIAAANATAVILVKYALSVTYIKQYCQNCNALWVKSCVVQILVFFRIMHQMHLQWKSAKHPAMLTSLFRAIVENPLNTLIK